MQNKLCAGTVTSLYLVFWLTCKTLSWAGQIQLHCVFCNPFYSPSLWFYLSYFNFYAIKPQEGGAVFSGGCLGAFPCHRNHQTSDPVTAYLWWGLCMAVVFDQDKPHPKSHRQLKLQALSKLNSILDKTPLNVDFQRCRTTKVCQMQEGIHRCLTVHQRRTMPRNKCIKAFL